MEKKKRFSKKLESFFAGQGFYIVLFLCAAIIGVSAWALLADSGTNVETLPVTKITSTPAPPSLVPSQTTPPETTPETSTQPEEPSFLEETEPLPVDGEADLYVWPVNGSVLTPHAVDKLVYNRTMADWRIHEGMDVSAEQGTEVMAIAGGTVAEIYEDDRYGTTVVLDHRNGVQSRYSNLAEVPTVAVGDTVMAGEILGSVGSTALWEAGEAPHLHLSMTVNGESVNPADYLPAR